MRLHHICIQTDQYEESKKFYMEILGFTLLKESAGFHNRLYNSWLELSGFKIELQTNKANEILTEFNNKSMGIVHFALLAEDVEAEYSRVKALGWNQFRSKNGQGVYSVEGGKLFKIIAPEGTIIEVRDQGDINL